MDSTQPLKDEVLRIVLGSDRTGGMSSTEIWQETELVASGIEVKCALRELVEEGRLQRVGDDTTEVNLEF